MALTEEWRPIAGFPDYRVSSQGRVMSLKLGRERILAGIINSNGYPAVGLRHAGHFRMHCVHRLMATAFYGPRDSETQTRHLDGNRLNNDLTNVVWGTRSENMQDKVRHGTDHNTNKTHCPQGHPYDAKNTYTSSRGSRHCRRCRMLNQRAYVARQALRAAGIAA